MIKKTLKVASWIFDKTKGYKVSLFLMTLFLTIISLSGIGIAVVSKNLVDAATSGDKEVIYGLLIVYSVLVFTEIFTSAINKLFNMKIWYEYAIKMRIKLYQKIVKSYWLDFTKLHSGDYIERITRDVATFSGGIINDIPTLLSSVIKFIVAFAVLAYYQPLISLFTFIFIPITFLISRVYSKKLRAFYKAIKVIDSEITSRFQEYLYNMQMVKVYNLEEMTSEILDETLHKKKEYILKKTSINNKINIVKSLGTWGGYFIAYSIGIFGIFDGTISFGVLVVFLQLFHDVQKPMFSIVGSLPKMISAFTAAERLIAIENVTNEDDLYQIDTLNELQQDIPSSVSVELSGVSFSYTKKVNQLERANLSIDAGELALIVGKSGSGKTTMIRLMLSLIAPDSGEIYFIDQFKKRHIANPSNRIWCSYVAQDNCIFSGTIESNIRQGNSEASDEEVIKALTNAEAFNFVSEMKDGIYAPIGERGTGISGGQAQRIAIARALASKAPVVIFDEATSGLDAETEAQIMKNIKKNYNGKTFIIITHRESIKVFTDKIYRIENGMINQEG